MNKIKNIIEKKSCNFWVEIKKINNGHEKRNKKKLKFFFEIRNKKKIVKKLSWAPKLSDFRIGDNKRRISLFEIDKNSKFLL